MEEKKRKTTINISLKEYNNKSRKGLYIYIKANRRPSRIYKYKGTNTEIDATKKYYEDKYIRKKPLAKSRISYTKAYEESIDKIKSKSRERIRVRRQADQYISRIKKQRPIDKSIRSGVAKIILESPEKKNSFEMKNTIKKLLRQVVLDKDLIEILAQDQNLEKIKHRFEYQLNIRNEKDETVMTMNKLNENPNKAMTQIKNSITEGEDVSNGFSKTQTARKFENNNWKFLNDNTNKGGKIKRTTLVLIFRK